MIATTTLNRIQELSLPYPSGWKKLLQSLGKTEADDEPLTLLRILESNGFEDAICALVAIDDCPELRLFAVRCVRQIHPLSTDPCSLNSLDVAERYAVGEASDEELDAAWGGSRAAQAAAWSARSVAWGAARDVACAAEEAAEEEQDAAWAEAWAEARADQERDFRDIFCTEDKLL